VPNDLLNRPKKPIQKLFRILFGKRQEKKLEIQQTLINLVWPDFTTPTSNQTKQFPLIKWGAEEVWNHMNGCKKGTNLNIE
jgi:hypothetical protein